MAITLNQAYPSDTVIKSGSDSFDMTQGKRVQIRYQDDDGNIVNLLDESVPVGKVWQVTISVSVRERPSD